MSVDPKPGSGAKEGESGMEEDKYNALFVAHTSLKTELVALKQQLFSLQLELQQARNQSDSDKERLKGGNKAIERELRTLTKDLELAKQQLSLVRTWSNIVPLTLR